MNDHHNPWQILGEKGIYDNNWIRITEYDVVNPSGGKGIYGKVHFKNLAIGIVPLDEEWNTWLVGQYRFPIGKYSWEIPEGGGLIGIETLESAKRELKEETGLVAAEWTEILRMYLSNSVTDEYSIIFLAKGLIQEDAVPEETESLTIKKMPFEKVYEMVVSGEITDAMSVVAIQKVKLMMMDGHITK